MTRRTFKHLQARPAKEYVRRPGFFSHVATAICSPTNHREATPYQRETGSLGENEGVRAILRRLRSWPWPLLDL